MEWLIRHAPITASKEQREDIDWQVCKQARMANKYKILYERYHIDGYDKFNARLVKVHIGQDEPEILLTANDLKNLHKRWGIEEGYKTLKRCWQLSILQAKQVYLLNRIFMPEY